MRELRTEIRILSKPEKVWEILTDFPGWPKWNPTVNKIEGSLKVGEKLSITMSDSKGADGKHYESVITEIEEKKRFAFIGTMMAKSIFSVKRIIELEDTTDGTRLIQREIYTGMMVLLLWKKLNEHALSILNSMNKALKKEAES